MNFIERILKSISYLPPFPVIVSKALILLRDPDADLEEIAGMIRFDQAVASNLLRLCNSSYVGLRRPITNIREAVVFVGLHHLRRILVVTGTRPFFGGRIPGYESRAGELWGHALAAAIVSSRFERFVPGADSDNVFIAALLHDVGKLVLSEFVMEQNERILEMVNARGLSFLDAERRVLGLDHAEIGGKVLALWSFSDEIVEAVRAHHSYTEENIDPLSDIVKLADIAANAMGYRVAQAVPEPRGLRGLFRRRGITGETVEAEALASIDEVRSVEADFGFSAGKEENGG